MSKNSDIVIIQKDVDLGSSLNVITQNLLEPTGIWTLRNVNLLLMQECEEWTTSKKRSQNVYKVMNKFGQDLFYTFEETTWLRKKYFGLLKPFVLHLYDANTQKPVLHFHRKLSSDTCLYPCGMQSICVLDHYDYVLGYIKQEWYLGRAKFSIKSADNKTVILVIFGPKCVFRVCGRDAEFTIYATELDSDVLKEIGKISKKWSTYVRELFSDPDYVGITFPHELPIELKALLLATTFILNQMYFQ